MKRPEKKKILCCDLGNTDEGYRKQGYNQSCDDWEAYLKPSVSLGEIRTIIHETKEWKEI